jgi:hypothetical protein
MEGFTGGLLVGLGIGVIVRPLLAAWLWTRERSRVSRAADASSVRGRSFRAEILPGSHNGALQANGVHSDGSAGVRPRRPPSG